GALTVYGKSIFDAGSNAIMLSNSVNNLNGAVSLTAGNSNATLNNSSATMLGLSNIGGDLSVTSAGDITQSGPLTVDGTSSFDAGSVGTGPPAVDAKGISQASGTSITQAAGAGAASFNAGTGALALTKSGNDFQGDVTATGAGISIEDKNDLAIAGLTDNNNG